MRGFLARTGLGVGCLVVSYGLGPCPDIDGTLVVRIDVYRTDVTVAEVDGGMITSVAADVDALACGVTPPVAVSCASVKVLDATKVSVLAAATCVTSVVSSASSARVIVRIAVPDITSKAKESGSASASVKVVSVTTETSAEADETITSGVRRKT